MSLSLLVAFPVAASPPAAASFPPAASPSAAASPLPAEMPPPYVTQWGSQGTTEGQLWGLRTLAADDSGHIYVAESTNKRIQIYDNAGRFLSMWGWGVDDGTDEFQVCTSDCQIGTSGGGDGQFSGPTGVALDASGNVYVSEWTNQRIQKFSSSGTFLAAWGWGVDDGTAEYQICTGGCEAGISGSGDGQFNNAWGIAVDSGGNVYVAEYGNDRVQKFSSTGTFLRKWGTFGSGAGEFSLPRGITVDASSNVYVVDMANERVQKFSSAGVYQTEWGSVGGADGQFRAPFGVAVDSSGNVFVVDSQNDTIQKFSSTGTFLTKWGTAGSGDGEFENPLGVAVDPKGMVYVTDSSNYRIQKFGKIGLDFFIGDPETPLDR